MLRRTRRRRPIHPVIAARLVALLEKHGSYRKAAAATGLTAGYLCHALRGYKRAGPRLLKALGLTETTGYK